MRVGVLIDGGFFQSKFQSRFGRWAQPREIHDAGHRMLAESEFSGDELFRIYYYDTRPYGGETHHPITGYTCDFSRTDGYRARDSFLRELALFPNVSLKLGRLAHAGWKLQENAVEEIKSGREFDPRMIIPSLVQKQVDITMALDIAWLSMKRIVEKVVLVTADSDFVPAMEFARREGMLVYLVRFDHYVKPELVEHCDGAVEVELEANGNAV